MAHSFSANQYQDAFVSKKLTNWEQPKHHQERPMSQDGFTQIISNDKGHILFGVPRSKDNPWGNYVGTWDLPKKIPGNCSMVKTSRSTYAQEKLERDKEEANLVLTGQIKNESRKVNDHVLIGTSRVKLTEEEKGQSPAAENLNPGSPNERMGAAGPCTKMMTTESAGSRQGSRPPTSAEQRSKLPTPAPGSRQGTPRVASRLATPLSHKSPSPIQQQQPQPDDYCCECES